jgi:hypothetical protein
MVRWMQRLVAEVLEAGDLAIDLTAGNGADTLFLARQVGPKGLVLAFDVQLEALCHPGARLTEAGISWTLDDQDDVGTVRLVHDSHVRLAQYTQGPARGIMVNLGYLPGGDPAAGPVSAGGGAPRMKKGPTVFSGSALLNYGGKT